MSDRCTGHCCHHFTLPMAPDELWAKYTATMKELENPQADQITMGGAPDARTVQDIHLIAPMAIYLGKKEDSPMPVVEGYTPRKDQHWYTCKHLVNGNCTIYEHRPAMCRNYPYGEDCNYADCTWDERKAKAKLPIVESGTVI